MTDVNPANVDANTVTKIVGACISGIVRILAHKHITCTIVERSVTTQVVQQVIQQPISLIIDNTSTVSIEFSISALLLAHK